MYGLRSVARSSDPPAAPQPQDSLRAPHIKSIAFSTSQVSAWFGFSTTIISRRPSTFRTLKVPPSQNDSFFSGRFFGISERAHASGSNVRMRQTCSSHLCHKEQAQWESWSRPCMERPSQIECSAVALTLPTSHERAASARDDGLRSEEGRLREDPPHSPWWTPP